MSNSSGEYFEYDGHQLYHESWGSGARHVVLLHGLLLDANINRDLAQRLASEGFNVHLLDLLGHGNSDKPAHASLHRMDRYARQVIAYMDHLGIDEAVLGGVSLGANVSLHTVTLSPERIRGLIAEMPVMEWATPAAGGLFLPMLVTVDLLRPLARLNSKLWKRLPRSGVGVVDSVLNTLSTPPESIAAVLHGVLVGPVITDIDDRKSITCPTLVIGHTGDLIHPLNDAENLARQVPSARLIKANSVFELRLRPKRLMREIVPFIQEAWGPREVRRSQKAGAASA